MIEITGPHLDKTKKHDGAPKCWYLYWTTPRKNADGTIQLQPNGRPVLDRHRPPYATRAEAEADKVRIAAQYEQTGSGEFLFDRAAAADYEAAKTIIGDVPMVEIARFWRLHHPEKPKQKIAELYPLFIADAKSRLGETRHISDLESRAGIYVKAAGERYPDTITRKEFVAYLLALKVASCAPHENAQSGIQPRLMCRGSIRAPFADRPQRGHYPQDEIGPLGFDEIVSYCRRIPIRNLLPGSRHRGSKVRHP